MTDHTHPDLEQRIAALERENAEDAASDDDLEKRIEQVRTSTDQLIVMLGQRIAALEARIMPPTIAIPSGTLPKPPDRIDAPKDHGVFVVPQHTTPPATDDAAVEAMEGIFRRKCHSLDCVADSRTILAAIRDGKVPLPEIARLRSRIDKIHSALGVPSQNTGDEDIDEVAEIARLRAELEQARRERDDMMKAACIKTQSIAASIEIAKQRDEARAEAEKVKGERDEARESQRRLIDDSHLLATLPGVSHGPQIFRQAVAAVQMANAERDEAIARAEAAENLAGLLREARPRNIRNMEVK